MEIENIDPDGRKSTRKTEVILTFLKVTCVCIELLTAVVKFLAQ